MTFLRSIGRWTMTALVINGILGAIPGELNRLPRAQVRFVLRQVVMPARCCPSALFRWLKTLAVLALALVSTSCPCSGPRNADAFPSTAVSIEETQCFYIQSYQATSPTANYDSQCGYVVAFGPKGNLVHPAAGYFLEGDWGDVQPSAATCPASHVAAMAWGYRCNDADCTQGIWEKIGNSQTNNGLWNSATNKCDLGLKFSAGNADYNTVQVQVRAYYGSGSSASQKLAKGRIDVYRNTGHCASVPAKPS